MTEYPRCSGEFLVAQESHKHFTTSLDHFDDTHLASYLVRQSLPFPLPVWYFLAPVSFLVCTVVKAVVLIIHELYELRTMRWVICA